MNNIDTQHYRFPGTRPFLEKDRKLFFGRNDDIIDLYKQIKLEQLIILFGKSGLGKSSLLNAGVLPELKEKDGFLSIPIRFNVSQTEKDQTPSKILLSKLNQLVDYKNFLTEKLITENIEEILSEQKDESFWLACKSIQIQKKPKAIFFVFDQFEELFSFNEEEIKRFSFLLATLIHGQTPQSFLDLSLAKSENDENYFSEDEINSLYEQLNIKFIIAIRSDKMSTLNRLKDYLPQILRRTYELKPLTIEQAKDAILSPAEADGDFISPKFKFSDETVKLVLNYLSKNGQKPIETFQLQMLCQYSEVEIIEKHEKNKNADLIVIPADIGDPDSIFERHYQILIDNIEDEVEQLSVRKMIEENMIIEGMRVPMPDKVIFYRYKISESTLQKLVDSRILRSEPNSLDGYSFEVSHDTLVEPIMTLFKIRKTEEEQKKQDEIRQKEIKILKEKHKRQRKFIGFVSLAAILSVAFAIFGIVMWQSTAKAKRDLEIARIEIEQALSRADKLVNAFYFYDDKYAVAEGSGYYYFIDKNGNEVDKLGYWESAEIFDKSTGFAKVYNNGLSYLLDTSGRAYQVAYQIDNLTPKTTALDLSENNLTSIPNRVYTNPQLEVILLSNNQIEKISPEIINNKNLNILNLNGNILTEIPKQIGILDTLIELYLKDNKLTSIPDEIGSLVHLSKFDLSNNEIEKLSSNIGQLTSLKVLNLSGNKIDTLPEEIWNLKNLEKLDLGWNDISKISSKINNLLNLKILYIEHNLIAEIPAEIGMLQNLIDFDCSNNQLSILPTEISNLTKLSILQANNNVITIIPPEIEFLTDLTVLKLYSNKLVNLPSEIGNLLNLKELYLSDNLLKTIPNTIGNLENLLILNLGENEILNIPIEIGLLTNLEELVLGNNSLSSLPSEIWNMQKLYILDLKNNNFTTISPSIGNLAVLQTLNLSNNQLNSLPAEFGNLMNLTFLNLSNNNLQNLPAEFENLMNLSTLDLSDNKFESFNTSFGHLNKIINLDLSNNLLSELPDNINSLYEIKVLDISVNKLNKLPENISSLSNLTELYLNNNQLSSISSDIYKLFFLKEIDLSNNIFEEFPREICKLPHLEILNLSYNHIVKIPKEIAKLTELEELNLSFNKIEKVPNELEQLTNLSVLNLSNNNIVLVTKKVGKLKKLEEFYLSSNQLDSIPSEIGELSELKVLHLNKNKIKKIPKELIKLKKLEEFDVDDNDSLKLSDDIEMMKSKSK